jgi:hypothetical protein
MGSLIKTGEVVKADPRDIIYLYRFIRECITWNFDDYHNFLGKVGRKNSDYYQATLTLNFLLVPKFRYSLPHEKIKNTEVQQADKIKYENFSNFDVYQFDPNSNGEILEIKFESGIRHSNTKAVARVWWLDLVVVETGFRCSVGNSDLSVASVEYYHSGTLIHETNSDMEDLQGYLRTLRWTQGKSYLELSKRSKPNETGVGYKIRRFEENFFLFVNFLYTLYTGGFEKNSPEYTLFKPFTDLLKTYGSTFEEVLSTVKEVMMFVG